MKNLLLLLNTMLFFITATLLFFDVGNVFVTIFSIIVIVTLLITFKSAHGNLLGLGFVFLAYNMLMHFGFGIIHFLIDNTVAKKIYASWTLAFLRSGNYSKAIIVSSLAFEAFTIAWLLAINKKQSVQLKNQSTEAEVTDNEEYENKICYALGILMLAVFLLYFIYLLITGRMSLSMSYEAFQERITKGNAFYSWMLVFYPTGLLYVIASSNGKRRAWGIALFVAIAVMFLLTGNKGEVFYGVLAALGILGYQKKRLNPKIVLLLCAIMFIIIPIVTSTRSTGVKDGFSLEFAGITEPFLEIGMQIRCLVYSIDGVAGGVYSLMHGYSYLKPISTVLGYVLFPLRYLPAIPIDLTSSKSDFSGYGFSQVAEGYLNFGVMGAILVFAIFGWFLGKFEFKEMKPSQICLLGSILVILINLSRNTFIFVPGQIAVMLIIYGFVKVLAKIKKRG